MRGKFSPPALPALAWLLPVSEEWRALFFGCRWRVALPVLLAREKRHPLSTV
ncbi:MAG: hypothetical protein KME26_24585 [Oscillatoria princeps RMCB-10]|nr:hypothetical protein [Oscillatoria princeps RMCB-10]